MASRKQPKLTPDLHVNKSTCEHTHVLALIHTLFSLVMNNELEGKKGHKHVGQAVVALTLQRKC